MSVKFTAQELNYLIYRYLEESGFKLTTLAFKTETQIDKLEINPEDVQRGALITYILKGLQYRDIEVHSNPDGTITNCEAIVPLIGKHACKRSMDPEPLVITTSIPNSYKTNEANQNLNDDLAKQQSQKDLAKNQSQELNYLIYRYLEESGFKLTTLAFKTETQIDKLEINPEDVQRGALITYILKGLQYRDIEVHSNPDGTITNCEAIVPLIGKHACKRSMDPEPLVITTSIPNSYKTNEANQNLNDDLAKQQSQKDLAKNQSGKKVAQKQIKSNKNQIDSIDSPELVKKSQGELNKITSKIIKPLIDDEYTTLEGHVGEVYFCKWHPNDPNVLATAGRDSVLRIWKTDHQGNFTDALKMGNDEFYYDNFICSVDWSVSIQRNI
ncbi:14516_t:CDS:2 [Entrophospora sp. SA101]|nr:14516_t:CDS:2 [Entrophospora sp. SA101]